MATTFTKYRAGLAFLLISALGVVSVLYGLNYYKNKATCGADVTVANARITKVRTQLATDQNEAVNTLLNSIGDLIITPPSKSRSKDFVVLFKTYRMETSRIAAEREATPLLEVPKECSL